MKLLREAVPHLAIMVCGILLAAATCTGHPAGHRRSVLSMQGPDRGCVLVTREEMEGIVGGPVEPPEDSSAGGRSRCIYPIPGGVSAVEIDVDWHAGASGWAGVKQGKRTLENPSGDGGAGQFTQPVRDLGDEAFVQSVELPRVSLPKTAGIDFSRLATATGVVWAKSGNAVMAVTVANLEKAKEKAIAVARQALSRM